MVRKPGYNPLNGDLRLFLVEPAQPMGGSFKRYKSTVLCVFPLLLHVGGKQSDAATRPCPRALVQSLPKSQNSFWLQPTRFVKANKSNRLSVIAGQLRLAHSSPALSRLPFMSRRHHAVSSAAPQGADGLKRHAVGRHQSCRLKPPALARTAHCS